MALGKDVWRRAVITRAKSLRKVSTDCERMLFHLLYGSLSSATGTVDADPELVAFTARVPQERAEALLAEAEAAGLLVWSPESQRAYLCGSFAADPPVSWFNWRGYCAELDKSPDCTARQAARSELGHWEDADAHGKGGQWVVDPRSTPARPPLDRGLTPDAGAGAGAGAGADAGADARPPVSVAHAPAASQAPQSNDAETATDEPQTGLLPDGAKPQPPRQMKRNTSVAALADDILTAYQTILPMLPQPRDPPTAGVMRLLLAAAKRDPDLDLWRERFRKVAASPHHRGENDRGWSADLAWVLGPNNCAKVDARSTTAPKPWTPPVQRAPWHAAVTTDELPPGYHILTPEEIAAQEAEFDAEERAEDEARALRAAARAR